MTPGERLKTARLATGMSADELAKRAGVTQSYITKLETNSRPMTHRVRIRLAFLLGVAPKDLA